VVLLRSWHAAVTGRTCPPPPSAGRIPFVDHEDRSAAGRSAGRLPGAGRRPDAGACLAYRAKYRGVGRLL